MNYHVMNANNSGSVYTVVSHVIVPNENNVVGVNLRTCLSEDNSIDKTSVLPWITTAEQTQLTNCELIERVIVFRTHDDVPNATKQSRLDALYTSTIATVQAALRCRYKFWHFDRDVA